MLLARHDQLDLPQYRRIACDGELVSVAPELLSGVAASRAALLAYLESGASAYGVNTGLGYLAARPVQASTRPPFSVRSSPAAPRRSGARCPSPSSAGRCCCG